MTNRECEHKRFTTKSQKGKVYILKCSDCNNTFECNHENRIKHVANGINLLKHYYCAKCYILLS